MKNIYKKIIASLFFLVIFLFGSHIVSAEEISYSDDLTVGSVGADVVSLQTWLESNGYLVMPPSTSKGYFGSKTREALASYQRTIGYPAYGFFGPMTRDYFNKGRGNVNSLNVISPNGGEIWQEGTTQNIKWNSPQYFKATTVDVRLMEYKDCSLACTASLPMQFDIAKNISANSNSYSWNVGSIINYKQPDCPNCGISYVAAYNMVLDGKYIISICESGTNVCTTSKKPFTITSPVVDSLAPVINSFNAPTSLIVGQTGTWTINATDPQNSSLNYSITWGDVVYSDAAGATPLPSVSQTSKYTHSYSSPGTYTVRVIVRNSAGLTTQSSATVQVTSNGQTNNIKVTSPNGGENWISNSTHQITWTNTNTTSDSKIDLYLEPLITCIAIYPSPASCKPVPIILDKNISSNAIYNWIVGTDIKNNQITAGNYIVKVCVAGTSECDQSDSAFIISNSVVY